VNNFELIERSELAPGTVGAFIDDLPRLETANVTPYVVAILLHRGAVARHELMAALTPHCCQDDIKIGGWDEYDEDWEDSTRLERIVDEALALMVAEGTLEYSEKRDLWVLTGQSLRKVLSWCSCLNGRVPPHLFMELGKNAYG
jgi:pyruvoyl-dependent arginine decarboxylase (PvlArgDC)